MSRLARALCALGAVAFGGFAHGATLKTIYSFCSQSQCADGEGPSALISLDGVLYGTTAGGGLAGEGTIFAVTPAGSETVLHSFGRQSGDGRIPTASLIHVGRALYGTTTQGGTHCRLKGFRGCGTVFVKTLDGKEEVIHDFGSTAGDGRYPTASLLNLNGTLYGTTELGGNPSSSCRAGCGTIFSLTPERAETVLYAFAKDGQQPVAALVADGSLLYGDTAIGGPVFCGTIFSVSPQGAKKVLHNFDYREGDGCSPASNLIDVGGTLYGTTYSGGAALGAASGGTVFSITPEGSEKVLYSFTPGSNNSYSDGRYPAAALTDVAGTLYGTTSAGGSSGFGTIYSVTRQGQLTVLYSFGTASGDGQVPTGLIDVGGKLYGGTGGGGVFNGGTIFELTP